MKPLRPPNAASVWDHNSAERESSLYSGVKHAPAHEAITSVRKAALCRSADIHNYDI